MNSPVMSLDASTSFDENVTVLNKMSIFCKKVLISVLVSIIFIGMALIVAVVFTRVHKIKESSNESPTEREEHFFPLARYVEANKCDQYNFVDDIQNLSFIASLIVQNPLIFVCTCIVVTNRHVIAEAHCFTANTSGLVIRTGSIYWNKKGRVHLIKKITKHENFSMNSFHNNIAVLETLGDLIFDSKITLERIVTKGANDKRALIVGWANEDCETQLTQQSAQIWRTSDCISYLKSRGYVCAALKEECFLGFPGLLIIENRVVGFWIATLTCKYHPLIFTNLSKNIEWINSVINR